MSTDAQTAIDIIRNDTNAAHYELLINRASSERQCSKLIIDFNQLGVRKAEEFCRTRYWLGGAVRKAHSLSRSGDGTMEKLSRDTGVSIPILMGSLRLYDLCDGRIERLEGIIQNVIDIKGKIGWGDVEAILRANEEVLRSNRERRVIQDRVTEIRLEAPGAAIMPSVQARIDDLEELANSPIVIPDLSAYREPETHRISRRRTIRSIASACNMLAEDLANSEPVTVQEIEIEGCGIFEVQVSLLPMNHR